MLLPPWPKHNWVIIIFPAAVRGGEGQRGAISSKLYINFWIGIFFAVMDIKVKILNHHTVICTLKAIPAVGKMPVMKLHKK